MARTEDEVAERTCIVSCRAMDEQELIRFVLAPDGRVVPDLRRRLPGRGTWVGLSRAAVEEACRRKLFARALRTDCSVGDDLPGQVEALLEREALGLLALANKAGLVVQGFAKVEAAVDAGRVRCLVAASDGSADGRLRLARRLKATAPDSELVECFDSEQLGLALGRVNVIHAAVAAGPLAEKLVAAARRLENYRG